MVFSVKLFPFNSIFFFVSLPAVAMKYPEQKQFKGEVGHFSLHFPTFVHHDGHIKGRGGQSSWSQHIPSQKKREMNAAACVPVST